MPDGDKPNPDAEKRDAVLRRMLTTPKPDTGKRKGVEMKPDTAIPAGSTSKSKKSDTNSDHALDRDQNRNQ